MILNRFLQLLVTASKQRRSPKFKYTFLFIGFLSFVVVTPALLALLGKFLSGYLNLRTPRPLDIAVGVPFIIIGLSLAFWAVVVQHRIGKGIPLQVAPPQKLITRGPYALCRNPMFLGAILYYFGLSSALFSVAAGLISFVVGFLIGGTYHRFIEEKELSMRFGEEYEKYRRSVPFLIPRTLRGVRLDL